ncbi:MAG TPA: hypothetical protein P5528_06015 [Steroidobacteraceae bacterium]|nr:hypothetical protein [Steroidobacteraceae bacterium]HRX88985.1 hypothetical protein [Steroidobacteraceae bacterium]
MKVAHVILALAGATAGCDSGRWIELPPIIMQCADLDSGELRAELANPDKFSIGRGMLQGVCAQSGAGVFTGETRCKDKLVEVRCKA